MKADCTIKMKDDDCFKMMVGQLNPQSVSSHTTSIYSLFFNKIHKVIENIINLINKENQKKSVLSKNEWGKFSQWNLASNILFVTQCLFTNELCDQYEVYLY